MSLIALVSFNKHVDQQINLILKMPFFSGDSRLTEQPQLTVMHTLWAREHNRIAKTLAGLNPTWKDEVIYQEVGSIYSNNIDIILKTCIIVYISLFILIIRPVESSEQKCNTLPFTNGFHLF